MDLHNYIEDLKEIKDIMNRSSRFISLSGLSGIAAGIIAFGGAILAQQMVFRGTPYLSYERIGLPGHHLQALLLIAFSTLVLAFGAGVFFTARETRKRGQKIWDHHTRRILLNLALPLVSGGIVCLSLLFKGFVGLVIPFTLIFYGMALVHVSKFAIQEMKGLGTLLIVLGIMALNFIAYSLWFWALGFGVLHIIYGIFVPLKYKS